MRAGYGARPTARANSAVVDAVVWVKPAGESDGPCGAAVGGEGAPGAGGVVGWVCAAGCRARGAADRAGLEGEEDEALVD